VQYLATITQTTPLTIHFSLYNPAESEGPVDVPRLLGPLGYFVSVEIMDENHQVVYQSYPPKVKLKLDPSRPESYQVLEPGYTYGIVLKVEDFQPAPGDYQLSVAYSNQNFRGYPGHELGEMAYRATLSFHLG
jgi:hypothetical protein